MVGRAVGEGVAAAGVLVGAVAVVALFMGQGAPEPAAPPSPIHAAPPTPSAIPRAERLAEQKAQLERERVAIDAFGKTDEFAAALKVLQAKYAEFIDGKERWAPVARGWLPMMAVDHWVEWHLAAEGRKPPVAIDVELPNHPYQTIVDLSAQLRAHDIEFLFVLFPSRLQLYPELILPEIGELPSDRFRGMVGATTRFLLALNQAGVESVDLAPVFVEAREAGGAEFNGELYLQRNKHWTPRAAELAAMTVADRIRTMEWFVEGDQKEGASFEMVRRTSDFGSTAGGQAPDSTPEKLALNCLRQKGGPPNPKDARRSPIVVLGDSFAKFYLEHGASFVDQLRRFTSYPIDAIMPMGGAETQCREQLARRGDQLRGKKVVLWLMQEDNLAPAPKFRTIDLFEE